MQSLTLLNLLNNYVSTVLNIYSIVFKCNDIELYNQSLLHCWVMLMVFEQHHYDKALLVAFSMFRYWKDHEHPLHNTLSSFLSAFDEYPVEKFYSILQARKQADNDGNQINLKPKKSMYLSMSCRTLNRWLSHQRELTSVARRLMVWRWRQIWRFLKSRFEMILRNPGAATLIPRTLRQNKQLTKWKLPQLFVGGWKSDKQSFTPWFHVNRESPEFWKVCEKFSF